MSGRRRERWPGDGRSSAAPDSRSALTGRDPHTRVADQVLSTNWSAVYIYLTTASRTSWAQVVVRLSSSTTTLQKLGSDHHERHTSGSSSGRRGRARPTPHHFARDKKRGAPSAVSPPSTRTSLAAAPAARNLQPCGRPGGVEACVSNGVCTECVVGLTVGLPTAAASWRTGGAPPCSASRARARAAAPTRRWTGRRATSPSARAASATSSTRRTTR